jgi:hypothetical protein
LSVLYRIKTTAKKPRTYRESGCRGIDRCPGLPG